MRSIAIIPARSGSKGLPDKNIKPLNGKPLLAYSIEAALASGMFDAVHVSLRRHCPAVRRGRAVPPQRRDLLRYRLLRGCHPGGAAPL